MWKEKLSYERIYDIKKGLYRESISEKSFNKHDLKYIRNDWLDCHDIAWLKKNAQKFDKTNKKLV